MSVLPAGIGYRRPSRNVSVFEQVQSFLEPTCPKIHGHHWLNTGGLSPRHELIQPELIGFGGVPRQIEPSRTRLLGPHTIFPPISRDEVAARIPHCGHAELAYKIKHILTKPILTSLWMPRLVDSGVNTSSKMLHERSEKPWIDHRIGSPHIGANRCMVCFHGRYPSSNSLYRFNVSPRSTASPKPPKSSQLTTNQWGRDPAPPPEPTSYPPQDQAPRRGAHFRLPARRAPAHTACAAAPAGCIARASCR